MRILAHCLVRQKLIPILKFGPIGRLPEKVAQAGSKFQGFLGLDASRNLVPTLGQLFANPPEISVTQPASPRPTRAPPLDI